MPSSTNTFRPCLKDLEHSRLSPTRWITVIGEMHPTLRMRSINARIWNVSPPPAVSRALRKIERGVITVPIGKAGRRGWDSVEIATIVAKVAVAVNPNVLAMQPDSVGMVVKISTKEFAMMIELVSLDMRMEWCWRLVKGG